MSVGLRQNKKSGKLKKMCLRRRVEDREARNSAGQIKMASLALDAPSGSGVLPPKFRAIAPSPASHVLPYKEVKPPFSHANQAYRYIFPMTCRPGWFLGRCCQWRQRNEARWGVAAVLCRRRPNGPLVAGGSRASRSPVRLGSWTKSLNYPHGYACTPFHLYSCKNLVAKKKLTRVNRIRCF
jgi:hypothetical protein